MKIYIYILSIYIYIYFHLICSQPSQPKAIDGCKRPHMPNMKTVIGYMHLRHGVQLTQTDVVQGSNGGPSLSDQVALQLNILYIQLFIQQYTHIIHVFFFSHVLNKWNFKQYKAQLNLIFFCPLSLHFCHFPLFSLNLQKSRGKPQIKSKTLI
jgi:hypothetical protein